MEPAAPGTEDEVKLPVQTHISKKETEQERLLAIKARLPNGIYGNVFEFNFNNRSEHWYCNLCQCPVMGRVYHHEIGKRHSSNMQNAGSHPFDMDSLQVAPGEPVPPGVEGEVEKVAQIQETLDNYTVGPLIGLEYLIELLEYDRDKEPSYLCLLCDKRGDPRTVIAHLGSYNHIIQYIQRHFTKCFRALAPYITKQYKRNWQSTMQKVAEAIEEKFGRLKPHVLEAETFTEKRMHYQNLIAASRHISERSGVTFEELIDEKQLTALTPDDTIMTKLSDDVSKRFYRKTGTEPGTETLKKTKRSPSPPVVPKPKKIKSLTASAGSEKRRSLSSVSSISSSDLSDFDPSQTPSQKKKDMREKYYKPLPTRYNKRSRSRSPPPRNRNNRGQHVHPWERSDYIRSRWDPSDAAKSKTDKFDEFKKLSTAIENDMDRILKQHEKNPEKHPQYNDEWKKFWNKRYKELQSEGKDVSNYDFKPEWIEFWNKRMIDIHNSEMKVKKDALRKRLSLPEEPAPICFKITGKRNPRKDSESKVEVPSTVDQDSDVIVIEDKDDDDTISSKRSHSPWESEIVGFRPSVRRSREKSRELTRNALKDRSKPRDRSREYRSRSGSREKDRRRKGRSRDREHYRDYPHDVYYRDSYRKGELPGYIKPPRVMRDVTRHPVMSPPLSHKVETVESDTDDTDINIVGVLRLLTALEEKLGSLGPKVIDLLAQALKMEKNEANSSEILLDNEMNCVLFETVKEKLKGQLLAGLVDYNQEKAFKNAIRKIASLVHYSGERKRMQQKETPKVDPIKVPGIGTVDKAAIAKQIASALVLQGKTDVSQAELEQLINAVVGMAEASKNSEKPMTTATFLQQLSQPKEPATETFTQSVETTTAAATTTEIPSSTNMEGLSDLDLQTLLQNFKDLCTDEQHSLISYLKKLESKEPERVERLRKFVNLDAEKGDQPEPTTRSSPFANRVQATNPIEEVKEKFEMTKVTLDSDEEEYSFEDVFKAAKQNVKENEERERKNVKTPIFKTEDFDLSNAKSLIANIMGQFKTKNESASVNLLGLGGSSSSSISTPLSEKNFSNLSDSLNLKPIIQNRVDLVESNSRHQNPEPDLPRNFRQNIVYPQHNQYMNAPAHSFDNQNQFNRQNFDQYAMRAPKYDNYNRW